jgi:hypothetical protein
MRPYQAKVEVLIAEIPEPVGRMLGIANPNNVTRMIVRRSMRFSGERQDRRSKRPSRKPAPKWRLLL